MKRPAALLGLLASAACAWGAPSSPPPDAVAPSTAPVYWLSIAGAVDAAAARYVDEGLARAEEDGAQLAVIVVDAAGGSPEAARDIERAVGDAQVPVAVYVEPLASLSSPAVLTVLMSADVAAVSTEAQEGLSDRAVDVIARDEDDLAAQLQDGAIDKGGRTWRLRPDGAPSVDWDMTPAEEALHALSGPFSLGGALPSPSWLLGGAAAALLFCLAAFKVAWSLRRMKPLSGREALAGRVGVVREGGLVYLDGQLWTADGYGPFQPGEKVRVTGAEGNTLKIEKF